MLNVIPILALLLNFSVSRHTTATIVAADDVPAITFCDLFKHPDQYLGRTVKFTAKYGLDIHEADFYTDTCPDLGKER